MEDGTDTGAMRAWLADCQWADVDADDIAALPAACVRRVVARHYDGGLAGFARDAA